MNVSKFFDDQFKGDQLPLPLHFRLLRRFEVARVDVAERLLSGGDALLDVGCADGELARRVASRYRRVVATDVSRMAIEAARHHALAPINVSYAMVDANADLTYENGSFDTVVALSTLQFLIEPSRFLSQAHRVLVPGGSLLVEVPNVAYVEQRLRLLSGRAPRTSFWTRGMDGGSLHYFTVDNLNALLEQTGFDAQTVTCSGVFAGLRTWHVPLLGSNIFVLARRRGV